MASQNISGGAIQFELPTKWLEYLSAIGDSAKGYNALSNATAFEKNLASAKAPEEIKPDIVYRALTKEDALSLERGEGLLSKAPEGSWTAAEHVANRGQSEGKAMDNSPWISTTWLLDVARG
ncbi:hypothetical protein [Pseudomonas sp. RIT-PI-S]|uniref:hypothetical protein n=1 Tax=Pseudomonas sp. RIT-PI-S TaxID=3035295 RepID=UPI0021DB6A2D|nr:hypothetical protein [Pseudomonas sp. RIT-PI-S]